MRAVLFAALAALLALHAEATGANPIRKVVGLMQNMQKEVEAEGEKEAKLFEKFMCFCSGSGGDLGTAAENSKTKISELAAKLEAEEAEKIQMTQDLAQHKSDRTGAKADVAEATAIRGKEKAAFEGLAADSKTNIVAMAKAIPALEKGMGGAALMQLPGRNLIRRLAESGKLEEDDRRLVLAFIDQTGDYVPQSGQIVGILKSMKDEMESELKEATESETSAAATFETLKASKAQEIKVASSQIETKMSRSGELAVSIIQTKDGLEDEKEELAETEKFAAELKTQCATKQEEWDARCKTRNDEIAAISEAIKILNDDDALDTFKKTMPSMAQTGTSFLQRRADPATRARKAQVLLRQVAAHHSSPLLRVMLFQLGSKLKTGNRLHNFDEVTKAVLKSVDNMVALLDKEQAEDDKTRDWCIAEFDKAGDEEKAAKEKVTDLTATVDEMTDSVAGLNDEIATLHAEIEALDKAVAEATEQRKEDHANYVEAMNLNNVAKGLVEKALNRLQQFYNPALAKKAAPPAALISMEERVLTAGMNFVQVSSATKSSVAPPEAPETFSGEVKKNKGSTGVLAMMGTIIQDLEMSIAECEHDEKNAQKDYAELMGDSQAKRAESSKTITTKEGNKAEMEEKLEATKESLRSANGDLSIAQDYTNDLHMKCDFLLENYEVRKEARAAEREGLKNAKATLNGADLGF